MKIEFATLTSVSLHTLVNVFNDSFANYAIPISFTPESLAVKMRIEGIDLSISAGAFENGRLAAFMLFASGFYLGRRTVWNGGTGVLPEYRGHALTQKMYAFITPLHRSKGFEYSLLEVMEHNTAARKSYVHAGLQELRVVDMCKEQEAKPGAHNHAVRKCGIDILHAEEWYHQAPTWQHTHESIVRAGELYTTLGYFDEDVLKGYCVFNPASGRIILLATDAMFRRMHIATALLNAVRMETDKPLSVLNVDASAVEAVAFLTQQGFAKVLRQVEMGMSLQGV
ncbi:MAG: GNAT family N-acetyltransferase [Bacteroidia bacterium]|jgi:ribosomal protein S18 acetylase RimI-like enzyme|nr:GNAT family N-acetyltransferase [Bacteroidia bacterium]